VHDKKPCEINKGESIFPGMSLADFEIRDRWHVGGAFSPMVMIWGNVQHLSNARLEPFHLSGMTRGIMPHPWTHDCHTGFPSGADLPMFPGESRTWPAMSPISSPCTKVCAIDPRSKLCLGCGRTLGEIGGWMSLSEDERLRIMRELPRRLDASRAAHAADRGG
jgi:uncharacterized protein